MIQGNAMIEIAQHTSEKRLLEITGALAKVINLRHS